ncbi:MAG: inorganic pyrophosphatase [Anaerolineales bacterium]|nr:MAG: inorganic pyrophosphatase [Anaerolineales bacterium]
MNIPSKYWDFLTRLVTGSEIVIDRPKGSAHPRYPDFVYPLDYGYLKNTRSSDGDEVDVWLGSLNDKNINGIICTADIEDRDVEIKLLLGCTIEEIVMIIDIHNQGTQAAFFIAH